MLRAASALNALRITDADTVALIMRNSPTVPEPMLAQRWLGAALGLGLDAVVSAPRAAVGAAYLVGRG